jgi:hypothetical protein
MIRPAILSALALAALAALAAADALAAPRPERLVGTRRFGEVVRARSFQFSMLPPRGPGEGLVVSIHEPEGMNEEYERELERMKRHPREIRLEDLHHVTLDRTPGPSVLGLRLLAQPFAPVAGNGFEGITQGGYIPGEPTVAAGPLNIFTAGNVSITVTNKDGTGRVETAGTTFFGVTPGEGAISDAQCYYDAVHGRFVALAFTWGKTGTPWSNFYLAISKTNDARGAWWLYKLDMSKDGTTPSGNWADYQSLGISEDKIAMTGQMFNFIGDTYQYQKVRVLDRAAAYAGQALTYVDFVQFGPPPGGDLHDVFVTKAARNLSPGDNTLHLLCVRTLGGSNVTYRTVTGSPTAPVLSTGSLVPVDVYAPAAGAAQKGSTLLVPTNDARTTDFYVRNGVLTCAWHTSVTNGGLVAAIRLFQMRTSDRAVLTDETFTGTGQYFYFPAVTVDSVGTVFLGFDRSSATEYPSAYATGKRRGDASLQPSVLLKAGTAPNLASRWGDFTGIDNDATLSNPGAAVAWYAGQYTKGTNTFGSWINRLTFTYGQVSGLVQDDCDGNAATAGDRTGLAGVTLSLVQGATTIATTTSGAAGDWNFGWLETGVYDVVVTPPASGSAVDALTGSGGNTQVRVGAADLQVDLTNAQASTNNRFLVTSSHPLPATTSLSPAGRLTGSGAFTLTVNGSAFTPCSVVRWDGADRPTTWLSAAQLTASIPAPDVASPGSHSVSVFTPAPAGGTSNTQLFTVSNTPDAQAPVVTVSAPTGGESWAVGSVHDVTWIATDNVGVTAVDLAWSTSGGASFPNVIAAGVPNTGTYAWTVAGLPSATARVRVVAHDGGGNVGADSSHANFTIAGWTITASAGANGAVTPAGAAGVADGATPSYAITPSAGFQVADVLVNGGSVGAVTNYTFAPVHANQTLSATFAPITYALNVTLSGSGSVTRTPDLAAYPAGSSVTLHASASPGWSFDGWTGDVVASVNPVGFEMDGPRNVTAVFSERVYTWNQTGIADFTVASNWTPVRTVPASDDMLVFSGGDTTVAVNMLSQTIGRLVISNATTVTFHAVATDTFRISGRAGTDLDIGAGSSLTFDDSAPITLAVGPGATGLVAGAISIRNASHRVLAQDAGSLVFTGGSSMNVGAGFGGNPFGNGGSGSGVNSVIFQNGSLLTQVSGQNPFGISVPNTALIFQAGSRYRVDGPVNVQIAGRTYADFEANTPSALTASGTSAFGMDSLIVTRSTLNLNSTVDGSIRGSIRVQPGAALNLAPASGTPAYVLAGSTPQSVNVLGSFAVTSNATLRVNNASGITLLGNLTLAGPLAFTSGLVHTGVNTLAITASGGVSGAAAGTGWVDGTLRRNIPAGASTRTFDVGDAAAYTPVTLAVTGAATSFDLAASTHTPDHPSLAASDLDPAKSVNRWWTLTPAGSPSLAGYDATFGFASADVDAGASPAAFVVRGWNGATWSLPATGARTATSTQATGLTSFGDFAVGEISTVDHLPPTIVLASPNGGEILLTGTTANLTWTAGDNVGVTGVDLLLSRDGAAGPFDPIATGVPNTGTYGWAVVPPYTSTAMLRAIAHDANGNSASDTSNAVFSILATTGADRGIPAAFALAPVYPNPMRTGGTFTFALPRAAHVRLTVLDVQGREVLRLAEGNLEAGWHSLEWRNGEHATLGAGLYFARFQSGGATFTRRFVLAR